MSSADVWMPLYIGDYLADTMRLSMAQHGAYMLLLMEQWRNGPLPKDEGELARIVRCDVKEWRRVGPAVLRYFEDTPDGYVQRRLEREREQAAANSNRRAEAGRKGAAKRWQSDSEGSGGANGGGNGNAMPEPETEAVRPQKPSPSPSPSPELPPSTASQSRPPKGLIVVPGWIPAEAWEDWCRFRRGKTWTPRAAELCIAKLGKLRDEGHAPQAVIEQSIANGWRGLFALSGGQRAAKPGKLDWLPEIMSDILATEPVQ